MVLIHGGAHTGSCYMATADGRPGWAPFFAAQGYQVVVPDWAGTGRSGYIPYDDLSGETVVKGLGKVLATLDRPAIVMTHSMSGYKGKRVALIMGTNDADHTAAIDKPIVDWLNDIGARAEFIPLGDRGIQGNGHMMMMESNSDQLAAGIAAWLQTGKFSASAS